MSVLPAPIGDFAPDLDPSTEGIITAFHIPNHTPINAAGWAGFIWMNEGVAPGLNSSVAHQGPFLPAISQGSASISLTGGSNRVFAGTASGLYEFGPAAWVDVSRGGGYTAGDNRWRFTAYGDFVYATDKFDLVQKSTGGNFANIASIPRCSFIDRVKDFVIIAGTNEATYGDQPDRWWCSALGNPDDFVPNIATQCVTNRITDTPGPIVASKSLGDDWIIYKGTSMYRGIYQGPPFVWEFTRVADRIGCLSQESVVKAGFRHFFVGNEDFYQFDGTVPIPVPNNLKNWFFSRMDPGYAFKTQGYYESRSSIIFWFYVSIESVQVSATLCCNEFVCVNLKNGRWGAGYIPVESVSEYISGGMTYDQFYPPTATTAWDALPAIAYDSPFFLGGMPFMAAILAPDHAPKTFSISVNGAQSGVMSFALGDVGNDLNYSTLSRVIAKYNNPTDDAGAQGSLMYYSGRALLYDEMNFETTAIDENMGKFYLRKSNRWHRLAFYAPSGRKRLNELAYDITQDGER